MITTHIFAFMLLITNLSYRMLVSADEESWVEPHAWGHLAEWSNHLADNNIIDVCNKCNAPADVNTLLNDDDRVALVYFKKFIVKLFGRKNLQYDETEAVYKRLLLFTLLPSQLDELEKLNDPRDLDIVLGKIFEKAHTPSKFYSQQGYSENMGVRALFVGILKDFIQLLKISEIQFFLFVAAVIGLGCFIKSRYRIGLIVLILGGFALFGYFVTYLECNKKLEEEQMINFIDEHQSEKVDNLSWYNRLKTYIFSTDPSIEEQKNKIRKSSKLKLPYCRPDHVLLMYFNDLFVKQMQFIIEKCYTTLSTLQSGFSFPYNYIASIAMLMMTAYMLKLTFKYILSPKAWSALLFNSRHVNNNRTERSSGEDRISGENLKMLLNAMHSVKNTPPVDKKPFTQLHIVSGVQEVREQLEAPSNNPSEPLTADTSKAEVQNITGSENYIPISQVASDIAENTLETKDKES